uniref:Calcium and integrin-binding protein 1-like n=1 Tax=Ciona intestinalis TaxID=7719 RepID=F6QG27_CIOIN|nr:calcium and integrin-binding protein 1-like [Ciona intestinalis]|eukprot:XP_009862115.1 calcium and integrin-binding protein 1-like [Ciona intestinalis]
MGSTNSRLSKEQLSEYTDLTYFTVGEINELFKKFESLDKQRLRENIQNRIPGAKLRELPEFKHNPFLHRLCAVFSTSDDDDAEDSLNFDDFLDMMNALSDQAPFSLKAKYAFQIFDCNQNGYVDKEDVLEIIKHITKKRDGMGDDGLNESLVQAVMLEADLDQDDMLGPAEFEHVLSKSPDFMSSFRIRL